MVGQAQVQQEKRNTAMVSRFAAERGLVDPLKARRGWGEEEPVTYTSGERSKNWKTGG